MSELLEILLWPLGMMAIYKKTKNINVIIAPVGAMALSWYYTHDYIPTYFVGLLMLTVTSELFVANWIADYNKGT